jgi:hypothetical protein
MQLQDGKKSKDLATNLWFFAESKLNPEQKIKIKMAAFSF